MNFFGRSLGLGLVLIFTGACNQGSGNKTQEPSGQRQVNQFSDVTSISHTDVITSAYFSPDSKMVLTTSGQNSKATEISTGREICAFQSYGPIPGYSSDDGRFVFKAVNDKTIQVTEVSSGQGVMAITDIDWRGIKFSPNGQYMISTAAYDVHVTKLETNTEIANIHHTKYINSARFSPNGKLVLTSSDDGSAKVTQAYTGREIRIIQHADGVRDANFSPDGLLVVTASTDKTAKIVEIASGKEIGVIQHRYMIGSAEFSADGKFVLTTSGDGDAKVTEVATGTAVLVNSYKGTWTFSGGFSSDSKHVLTYANGDINPEYCCLANVTDIETEKHLVSIKSTAGFISLKFSADDKLVIAVSDEKVEADQEERVVRIFDVSTGKEVSSLKTNKSAFVPRLSPDSQFVVVADVDGKTAKIVKLK